MNFEFNEINMMNEEKIGEKHRLFNDCVKLGSALILYQILLTVFAYTFYYVTYFVLAKSFTLNYTVVVTYLIKNCYEFVTSTPFTMALNISVTSVSLVITGLVAKLLLKLSVGEFFKPTKQGAKTAFVWMPASFVINMIFSLMTAYLTSFLGAKGINVPTSDLSLSSPSTASVVMQFTYVIILGPIFEETIYRGLIIGTLSKYGSGPAVLMSALAFGLMHGNIPQAVSAFATGVVYGVIAVNCGSVVPTIIIHSLNNLVANMPDLATAFNIPYFDTFYSMLEIAIALAGFFVLFTKHDFLRYKKDGYILDKKTVSRTIFTNPAIFLYLLILIYDMVRQIVYAN